MQTCTKDMCSTSKNKITKTRNYQERSVPKFLKKVFHILEENKHSELVSWTHDGLAIAIKKPIEFAEKILPLYFKHSNFASFIRQLNMYKFKKKKNYQYDDVYLHEMFQRGRMKAPEDPILAPFEMKAFKENVEIDVDNLINENLYYKRIHKTLSTQVQFIESKLGDLRNEIETIYTKQQQSKTNEQFLKNIVKGLTRIYGYENIERVIEAMDAEETLDVIPTKGSRPNQQFYYPENARKAETCNKNLYQMSKGYNTPNFYDEDTYVGKDHVNSYEYQPMNQSPTIDDAQTYLKSQNVSPKNGLSIGKSFSPQGFEIRNIFNSDESDELVDSVNSTSSKTYHSWLRDLEKRKNCAEAFPGHSQHHPMGGLDIDDLYHRTDF